jgi:hypothetical protein
VTAVLFSIGFSFLENESASPSVDGRGPMVFVVQLTISFFASNESNYLSFLQLFCYNKSRKEDERRTERDIELKQQHH